MLQEQRLQEEAAADELAQFLLSGGIAGESTAAADTREMSEILFGGPAPASGPALTPEDVDLVEQHDSYVGPEADMVELVEATDADLAAYMLGGDAPAGESAAAVDAREMSEILFGGPAPASGPALTPEDVDLVEQHDSYV